MKHVLLAPGATRSGLMAALALAALNSSTEAAAVIEATDRITVDPPPGCNPALALTLGYKTTPTFSIAALAHDTGQPYARASADKGRRPDLLRRRHSTLEQRGVQSGSPDSRRLVALH